MEDEINKEQISTTGECGLDYQKYLLTMQLNMNTTWYELILYYKWKCNDSKGELNTVNAATSTCIIILGITR